VDKISAGHKPCQRIDVSRWSVKAHILFITSCCLYHCCTRYLAFGIWLLSAFDKTIAFAGSAKKEFRYKNMPSSPIDCLYPLHILLLSVPLFFSFRSAFFKGSNLSHEDGIVFRLWLYQPTSTLHKLWFITAPIWFELAMQVLLLSLLAVLVLNMSSSSIDNWCNVVIVLSKFYSCTSIDFYPVTSFDFYPMISIDCYIFISIDLYPFISIDLYPFISIDSTSKLQFMFSSLLLS